MSTLGIEATSSGYLQINVTGKLERSGKPLRVSKQSSSRFKSIFFTVISNNRIGFFKYSTQISAGFFDVVLVENTLSSSPQTTIS